MTPQAQTNLVAALMVYTAVGAALGLAIGAIGRHPRTDLAEALMLTGATLAAITANSLHNTRSGWTTIAILLLIATTARAWINVAAADRRHHQ